MSRFVECGRGRLINADSIARVEAGYKRGDNCTVITKDGRHLSAPHYVYDDVAGRDHVVQLIPTDGKYQISYVDDSERDSGKLRVYDFPYFAVCANGEVRPFECVDGCFDFADTFEGYVGFDLRKE